MYTLAYRDGFISNGIVGSRPIVRSTHSAIHDNTLSCIIEIMTTQPGIGCQPINHFALNVVVLVGVVSVASRYIPAVEYHIWYCRVSMMKR
jgi:hypothetical protein